MIFDSGPDVFESEKERNLYYKFFGGYLFNEMVPGLQSRLKGFCEWLNEAPFRGAAAPAVTVVLGASTSHVSFDNHAYLFGSHGVDRGEFADIMIHDRANRMVVTLEAKVHSDWSFAKDILANDARLRPIKAQMTDVSFVQCLLIRRTKWDEAERLQNHPNSNWSQFKAASDNRFRVLFWEDLLAWIDAPEVRKMADGVLTHPPKLAMYGFRDSWFWRE